MTTILAALLFSFVGCNEKAAPKSETFTIAREKFELDLAVTRDQITRGMSGRKEVGDHEGMLFIFPDETPRRFWMKDCLVPLDVIFLDSQGRIVSIHTMPVITPDQEDAPPSYSSRWPARFAIELRGGRAGELKLKPGDKLDLPVERLKKWAR